MSEITAADIQDCAAEPIRIPGAIQPYGALAVVDPKDLRLRHASDNLKVFTGFSAEIGDRLGEAEGARDIANEVARWRKSGDSMLMRVVSTPKGPLQLRGQADAQGLLLEFEAPPATPEETFESLYPRLRLFLDEIGRGADLQGIVEAAAREVKALTGFSRILLYSFDEKGDGRVIAEENDGELPSYLNQRFPASDIPAQARELYKLNRVRLIADAWYTPSPVTPATSPIDNKPLDLSHAGLRSVSPIHLEYMRNMGTGSSMSISIVVDGDLWGLISGHSRDPKHVNAQVRTACDILGQVLSLQIEARLKADLTSERLSLKHFETELLARLAAAGSYQQGLADNPRLWLGLTGARGAAVITRGQVQTVGETPDADDITALATKLGDERAALLVTDCLSDHMPEAKAFADVASGMLAIAISQIHPDYILWFRPEAVRTVEWAGNPHKSMDPGKDRRLHPRASFEMWKQQVRLHSLPWRPAEVESADAFRNSIQTMVLRRAEERAELSDRLERANKELESFSYSVSHDLRAPFRHVAGFAELLAAREPNLSETSKHYVQSIADAALAAGRLVDDLLNFSQLGRASLNRSPIDMQKLAVEVRRSMEPDLAGRQIQWAIGPLPKAWGDGAMLRQALQNLFENAVKYTSKREDACIVVEGVDTGDTTQYIVRDNGVGFEMAYVHKLFGVFQRLHRTEDFEGTGIGLALVKRIVERHGGTVAAEGAPDKGAAFTITLPKRDAQLNGETRG